MYYIVYIGYIVVLHATNNMFSGSFVPRTRKKFVTVTFMKHDYSSGDVKTGGKSGLTNLFVHYSMLNLILRTNNIIMPIFFSYFTYLSFQCSEVSISLQNMPYVYFDHISKTSESH